MSIKMKENDPAYFLLDNGPPTQSSVYNARCYICTDDEFARMGLPLCFPCSECGGHVAADDTVCDDCGFDSYPYEEYGMTRPSGEEGSND
jgi:hypothetical protein